MIRSEFNEGFREGYVAVNRNPLAPSEHQDFDFETVERNLGDPPAPGSDETFAAEADQLRAFLVRLLGDCPFVPSPEAQAQLTARVIAEAQRMFPEWSQQFPIVRKLGKKS